MAFSDGRTTIILGAGASKEAGLPTGRELKARIGELLDIRYEHGFTRISGSAEIAFAFRIKAQGAGEQDINPYLQASRKIRDAMPQAVSIDSYLDAHADDNRTVIAGKLAIAQSILEAERKSTLFIDRHSDNEMIDFSRVEDTWFNKFVQLLTENCRAEALPENLTNLSIISFNYDRCLEHFLYYAIQNYYRIPPNKAADVLSSLKVFHPYGRTGSLPWTRQESPIDFGADPTPRDLLSLSEKIRTFAEGTDSISSSIDEIRGCVAECDRLIFLGFAFHQMNMQLLSSVHLDSAPTASFGTALGLSKPDCTIVEQEISRLFSSRL